MVKYDNIPGFPGYYISKRGGLWSNHKNGQWKKLKPHLNKMIQRAITQYSERSDYNDVNYFLEKLIADEEHHMKLLKEAMGMDKSTKGVTVIIK